MLVLLLSLGGCPTPKNDDTAGGADDTASSDDTAVVYQDTCPEGEELGKDDIGCTCGPDTLDHYYGCETSRCVDHVLSIDDSQCC